MSGLAATTTGGAGGAGGSTLLKPLARTADWSAFTVHVCPLDSVNSAVASKMRSWAPSPTCHTPCARDVERGVGG